MKSLIRKVEGIGHKFYLDSLFPSPIYLKMCGKRDKNCFGIVRKNYKGIVGGL
jgi:hypothetical protein